MSGLTYEGGFEFSWYFRYIDEDLYDGSPLQFNIYAPVKSGVKPDFVTLTWNKD
jgi:hypothetical protein